MPRNKNIYLHAGKATNISCESYQMSRFIRKKKTKPKASNHKVLYTARYKQVYGIKGTIIKEINESIMALSHQVENINTEIEFIKKNRRNYEVGK